MTLTEAEYSELASQELTQLLSALDRLADDVDAELSNDIVTIEFDDDDKFIINSHRAARQIWMAAGRSAWHFDYDLASKKWLSKKNSDELWSTMSAQLSLKLGRSISLSEFAALALGNSTR